MMRNGFVYGVISHQGDYSLHKDLLRKISRKAIGVLAAEDLKKVNALIIPGGESTTLIRFFDRMSLWDDVHARIKDGMPVFGTCAGLILLAKDINNSGHHSLSAMDVDVIRNAYGRQVDSFEAPLKSSFFGDKPLNGIFIRAPRIVRIGSDVEVLANLDSEPVLVRTGNILGAAFHPELTDDKRVHELFVEMAEGKANM